MHQALAPQPILASVWRPSANSREPQNRLAGPLRDQRDEITQGKDDEYVHIIFPSAFCVLTNLNDMGHIPGWVTW
jgi:hypothetical protein